jgi:hypothetical protein
LPTFLRIAPYGNDLPQTDTITSITAITAVSLSAAMDTPIIDPVDIMIYSLAAIGFFKISGFALKVRSVLRLNDDDRKSECLGSPLICFFDSRIPKNHFVF